MPTLETIRHLVAYENWANRKALDSIREVEEGAARAVLTFAHLAATQRNWFARIAGEELPVEFFPEVPLEIAEPLLRESERLWHEFLEKLDEEALDQPVVYTNTQGEKKSRPLSQILLHLVLHGQHHRGQIANFVRQAGGHPAKTDFILVEEAPPSE
jgi:uncharacterized damage-inducible protein DinB